MYRPPLSFIAPYLYEAWYDTIDYAYAYQWFRSHTPVVGGGCSTVRKGNLIGRNLDWTYSESAEFVVHTDGVVGVANAIPGLTDAFVKSGADDEIYKIVPFMLSDGMNKHGLMVSTLVVPTDKGDNSVVRPLGPSAHMMCTLMLPRYMLDHFRTALGAMTYFKDSITLYHPKTLQDQHYDQHFIIADAVHTLCMEFVDGRYNVTNINHKPFVTNFHLTGVEFNADGSVNTPASGKASDNKITPNGSGLERYNMINDAVSDITFGRNAVDMAYLMERLSYTRAYQSSPDPAVPRWDTEFVGNGLTVDSPTSEFDYIQNEAARVYTNRSRILGDTWQTVHSAIYDVQEKKLRLYAQENYDTHWEVSVMADQTHVQHLRGNTARNDAFTGANGELTVNTDSHSIRVHDGVMQGGYGTVHATVIDGAYEGMDAPKDLPIGAHVISGTGKLDTAVYTENIMPYNTREVLTSSGTYTAPVSGWYKVTCIGGGGGGSGSISYFGGYGGASGEYITDYLFLAAGQAYTFVVGAGGTGVAGQNPANNGGDTRFSSILARGGYGGRKTIPVGFRGFAGGIGTVQTSISDYVPSSTGGGLGGGFEMSVIGKNAAFYYGGGGSGAGKSSASSGDTGGNGYQGCVILEYYDPAKTA